MEFIVIEGIDGVGKTTNCASLEKRLNLLGEKSKFFSKKSVIQLGDDAYEYRQSSLKEIIWGKGDRVSSCITTDQRFMVIAAYYLLLSEGIKFQSSKYGYNRILVDGWYYRHIIKTSNRTKRSHRDYLCILEGVLVPDRVIWIDQDPELLWSRRENWTDHEVGLMDGYCGGKDGFVNYQNMIREKYYSFYDSTYWTKLEVTNEGEDIVLEKLIKLLDLGV